MVSRLLFKILSINLKWKLLIPFLLLSLVGTTLLVYIGLTSQQELIKQREKNDLLEFYKLFLTEINHKKDEALSLATVIAENRQLQLLLARKDREGLKALLFPVYQKLQRGFGVLQFHLHTPPGKSLLRLHKPEQYGEMISYRKTVMEAMKSGKGVAGLEWGLTGLSIRGVVPVFMDGVLVGSVEIGIPFGEPFLHDLKKNWGPDFSVYEKKDIDLYYPLATTSGNANRLSKMRPFFDLVRDQPLLLIAPAQAPDQSILFGPLKDYYRTMVALVEIEVDRSSIKTQLLKTKEIMIFVALAGICVSFFLVWLVASLFIRPIKEIVTEAQEIAAGQRESRLHLRPNDEIGVLTQALNTMLDALRERRLQIESYAKKLERRVQERTADLVSSEEKYRTLVDNLPLIVYRLLEDGTIEFINHYFTEKLGFSPEEAVGDRNFWRKRICRKGEKEPDEILDSCFQAGKGYQIERVVEDKKGYPLTFMDRAIPLKDDQGKVRWIDGIMLDITELKKLQERAIRTEEIRVLGEISARFAHELRNPLVTVGGFARRLRKSLKDDSQNRKFAQIIVEEVAKLEDILQVILSSIEPFTLCVSDVDLNGLIRYWLDDLNDQIKRKKIHCRVSLSPSLPLIPADEGLLNRALENFLKHAVIAMPEGEELFLSTSHEDESAVLIIKHRATGLSEEDLEQFFFPRLTDRTGQTIQDLPLSNIIIHRHGGKVDVMGEDTDRIVLRIELPLKSHFSGQSSFGKAS